MPCRKWKSISLDVQQLVLNFFAKLYTEEGTNTAVSRGANYHSFPDLSEAELSNLNKPFNSTERSGMH